MKSKLWSDCSKAEQHRYRFLFSQIQFETIHTKPIADLAMLFQWIFDKQNISTRQVDVQESFFDMSLQNHNEMDRAEHARFYLRSPVLAVGSVTQICLAKPVHKIHIFTLGKFTASDLEEQNKSPLFLHLRERGEVLEMIQSAKQACLNEIEFQRANSRSQAGSGGWWAWIKKQMGWD